MTKASLLEWHAELERRLARSAALVYLGLPDRGFAFLIFEIYRFRAARAAVLGGHADRHDRRAA